MTLQYFFSDVCTYLAIIPAAIFCFLPTRQYMKWSSRSVILAFSLLFILLVPAGVCLGFFFHLDDNITVGIMIIIFFIGYNRLLTTRFSQNLNTFCLCIALMAFAAILPEALTLCSILMHLQAVSVWKPVFFNSDAVFFWFCFLGGRLPILEAG